MSSNLTEQTITEAVQRSFDTSSDERFRELFVSLVQHLHDFAREVRLTGDEWFTAMDFIERMGKISSPTRQEVVLLSLIHIWRSDSYVSSNGPGAQPLIWAASFQPRFMVSCMPRFRPGPPKGLCTWAASPSNSTRPSR